MAADAPAPLVPRYGAASLADVLPSLLAGLDVPGMAASIALPPARKVCLLLIDGLGWHDLREHAAAAPCLAELARGGAPITAGFPTTTATSITTLGTGAPPGDHGIVGYTFAVSDDVLLNALSWAAHGTGRHDDLRRDFAPEDVQRLPTAFQRAAAAGVAVRVTQAPAHQGSGLTRAALRGGEAHPVFALGDLAAACLDALSEGERVLCYGYHGDLDLLGHVFGPGSLPWLAQLAQVDRLVETIAARLPAGALLAVTADHGMVGVAERVDFDTDERLRDGVAMLGGEARARHVYARPGAAADVLETWRAVLGERAWVVTGAQAVDAGWFGPGLAPGVRSRIGDVVVAARGRTAVVRSAAEPRLTALAGQHGSLTAAELLIPLLVTRGTG